MPASCNRLLAWTFICCWLIGIVLVVLGVNWLDSMPKGEGPCHSSICYLLNTTCPSHAPCLCLKDDGGTTYATCESTAKSNGKRYFAWTILIIGAMSFYWCLPAALYAMGMPFSSVPLSIALLERLAVLNRIVSFFEYKTQGPTHIE